MLRPLGRFYAEEVLSPFILHPVWRRVFDHPLEDRFDEETFAAGLREVGLRVVGQRGFFGQVAWVVAERAPEGQGA